MVALAGWCSNNPYTFAKWEFNVSSVTREKKAPILDGMRACRRGGWTADVEDKMWKQC